MIEITMGGKLIATMLDTIDNAMLLAENFNGTMNNKTFEINEE